MFERQMNATLRSRLRGTNEVDFVVNSDHRLIAIEVKSGTNPARPKGLDVFNDRFGGKVTTLVVGTGGVPLQEFLESSLVRV